jgi:hypothetical protein
MVGGAFLADLAASWLRGFMCDSLDAPRHCSVAQIYLGALSFVIASLASFGAASLG